MEEEKIDPINCSAVVRAVKQSGTFMLLDRDEEHYLGDRNIYFTPAPARCVPDPVQAGSRKTKRLL